MTGHLTEMIPPSFNGAGRCVSHIIVPQARDVLNIGDQRIIGSAGAEDPEVSDVRKQMTKVVASVERPLPLPNLWVCLPEHGSERAFGASAGKIRAAPKRLFTQQEIRFANAIARPLPIIGFSHWHE